jgi:hypothetical protein
VPVGIDPWLYPVYAVLYSRSSGGKTLVHQSVGEAVGLHGLARLGEREMLLRQDALRAEHDLHVLEPAREPQQELEAAREGDGLQRRAAVEQLLPACLILGEELGTEHGQRLGGGLQTGVSEQVAAIARDFHSSMIRA